MHALLLSFLMYLISQVCLGCYYVNEGSDAQGDIMPRQDDVDTANSIRPVSGKYNARIWRPRHRRL